MHTFVPSAEGGVPILTIYPPVKLPVNQLENVIVNTLDARKADDIVSIDLTGKSDFADRMVIASGTSARHVASLAQHVVEALKEMGFGQVAVEGMTAGDWVLVDAGNIVINLFRPDVREHYQLEKMWSVPAAGDIPVRMIAATDVHAEYVN